MRNSLVLSVLFVLGCNDKTNQASPESFDLSHVTEYINEMNKVYGERAVRNDIDYYKARYTEDACSMPPNFQIQCGIESILKLSYRGPRYQTRDVVTAVRIYGGPSVVIEEGTYEIFDLNDKLIVKGKFIALWKQEDGKWKLYREIWNDDPK